MEFAAGRVTGREEFSFFSWPPLGSKLIFASLSPSNWTKESQFGSSAIRPRRQIVHLSQDSVKLWGFPLFRARDDLSLEGKKVFAHKHEFPLQLRSGTCLLLFAQSLTSEQIIFHNWLDGCESLTKQAKKYLSDVINHRQPAMDIISVKASSLCGIWIISQLRCSGFVIISAVLECHCCVMLSSNSIGLRRLALIFRFRNLPSSPKDERVSRALLINNKLRCQVHFGR